MKRMAISISLILVASAASAGVLEKKSMRAAEEVAAEAAAGAQAACGIQDLTVDFQWDAYEKFNEDNSEIIKEKRTKPHYTYGFAGSNAAAVLKALADICKDPDYKEVISEVNTLVIAPNESWENNISSFSVAEKEGAMVLTATLIASHRDRRAEDFEKDLKAIW